MISNYLGGRGRSVHVGLVVELLKLLQCGTWLFGQAYYYSLSAVVAYGKTRRGSLLWWLEEVEDAVTVDLEVFQGNLNLGSSSGVLFYLSTSSVYAA